MLQGKKVFISGGAGVIGNALVAKLYKLGAVILVGDLEPKPQHWPADILYRQGDLNYITREELESFGPEVFFHLAATFERSTETYDFWEENYHHNVNLSHHLMTCLKESETLKKVIFASSYLIYNPQLYSFAQPAYKAFRLQETDHIYPRNLCGVAKLLHEIELRFLNEFAHFETISARIFRSYGRGSRDVISRWIRALLKGEELTVFKKEGLFDYIFADEVAEGLIRLALSGATGIVNLGNDNARRVEEVLAVLKQHFPNMRVKEDDNVDIPYEGSQANVDLLKELTGWSPTMQLEDTIPLLIAYEKDQEDQSAKDFANVLVTSISRKIPLLKAVRKSIKKLGHNGKLLGGDIDSKCLGRYFVDGFWEMPRLTELSPETLSEHCRQNNIKYIIPTRDGELAYFAKYRQQLAQNGIRVMVSNYEAVQVCLDKLEFYQKAKELGFPVIATALQIDEVNAPRYVVKERYGAGSVSIGINLSPEEAVQHAKNLVTPIYQPMVEGREVSVDLYIDQNGQAKGVVARYREHVVHGESQITTTFRDVKLEKLCSDFVEAIGLYGHMVMQIMIDSAGEYHIIECNSRFGGASTLGLAAGLDSFYWFLLESMSNNIQPYPFIRSLSEKRQVRHAEDVVFDIGV